MSSMLKLLSLASVFVLSWSTLHAIPPVKNRNKTHHESLLPWFTGPFLAPTPINMEPGHPAIEPSITLIDTYGMYNSDWSLSTLAPMYSINPVLDFQFGLTDKIGIEILAGAISNFKKGKSATNLQDTFVYLGYQLLSDEKDSWTPNLRLDLHQTFPTGRYQKLQQDKLETDSTGSGAYNTGFNLIAQKMFYFKNHLLSLEWALTYLFPTSVNVKGLNAYGGTLNTKGTVKPGNTLRAFFSGEYMISQSWVFACDIFLNYQGKSRFSGFSGIESNGSLASVGSPSSYQLSLTPSLEYNFSSDLGILFGSWFTIAGKNSQAYASIFASLVYVF